MVSAGPSSLPARLAHQLHRAHSLNPTLNAFTAIASQSDLEHQLSSSSSAASKNKGKGKQALSGKTVAVKDVFATTAEAGEGLARTTCASRMLQDYRSPYEATVVRLLRENGALLVGKTNMDEFGMGSANAHSHFGPALNPSGPGGVDATLALPQAEARVPGGSSGGSAAAVAAGLCDVALASDTGGSTRLPASYTGVVGFKPSYGLLSRYGMVAYASSLDTVGLMSRTVEGWEGEGGGGLGDVLDILAQHDPQDPTSVPVFARERASKAHRDLLSRLGEQGEKSKGKGKALAGIRIGVPADLYPHPSSSPLSPLSSSSPIRHFLRALKENLGATLVPVRVKTAPLGLGAYYVIASAEASSNLGRYRGVEYGFRAPSPSTPEGEEKQPLFSRTRADGFGKEVKKRVLLGTFALSAEAFDNYYLQAQRIRLMLQNELEALFRVPSPLRPSSSSSSTPRTNDDGVDFLVHPSALSTAPLLSSYTSSPSSPTAPKAGTAAYTQDLLSLPSSLAGLPALSLPAGRSPLGEGGDGWPVGMTLVGQWGADRAVVGVAAAVERAMRERKRT
ncbi:hypothetical protein JCM8097_004428 [Rhodosporidiobolus ruineniae]